MQTWEDHPRERMRRLNSAVPFSLAAMLLVTLAEVLNNEELSTESLNQGRQ
jgi:hypothetical protein